MALLLAAAGAALCALAIVLLRPLLIRYALARPSARGLHTIPTPQGGGIAVLIGAFGVILAGAWLDGFDGAAVSSLALVCACALGLALLGGVDDIRPLPALPRLAAQVALVALALTALPEGVRIAPVLPFWLERLLLILGGVWFVNLVNFMDGMDWMSVAEMLPLSAALALLAHSGALAWEGGLIALGLFAGMLGFAPFNRPVARLFLGDVGSLSIALLAGYGLALLAGAGHLAAAIILPLYYLADSTVTLLRRLARGEKIWEPHCQHFYQQAVGKGMSATRVAGEVFALNIVLAGLAAAAVALDSVAASALLLALAALLVAGLLRRFAAA